jgi:hypothetical protein
MLSYNFISRWFFSTNHKCGIYICLARKISKTLFYIQTVHVKLYLTYIKNTQKVKQKYKVNFFKRIVIQTLMIVFLIGNTKTVIFFKFLVNAFLYLLSSLFYETNNQFQIFKMSSINGYNAFIIQNLKDSFKKTGLFTYNHKNVFHHKHLGTYRKFYYWNFHLIKRCNTTSVIYNHKFLTSYEIKILKTLCLLKKTKNKYIKLFSLLKNPKFLFINFKIITSKLTNLQFTIYKITIDQVKYEWFKEIAIRLHHGNFQFICTKTLKKETFYNYNILKLGNLKNEIVYQSIKLILELIYEPVFLNSSYGYRPTKGCHSALKQLKFNWANISWILKFNIQKHLSHLNFNKLMNLLKIRIKDQSFLNIIKRLLQTNFKDIHNNYLSIFYNIYLHTFDLEILAIQKKLDAVKEPYKVCKKKQFRILTLLKYGIILTHKNQTIMYQVNRNKDRHNHIYKNYLKYIRYNNHFLLGFQCSNVTKHKIEKRITTFFNSNLKLLILNKNFIYVRSNKIRFLSFELSFIQGSVSTKKFKTSEIKTNKYKNIKLLNKKLSKPKKNLIIIKASLKNFKNSLIKDKLMSKSNKPKGIKWLLSYSNKLIVKWFYTIAINTLKLYCCCANFYKIKIYVDYIIRFSALYTLALKNKMSFSSILNTWSRDMVIKDKKNEYVLAHYISKTCINNQKNQFLTNIHYDTLS